VGFSGGLDSTVLLHALLQHQSDLPTIKAIHINHGLSVNASAWEAHCAEFCKSYGAIFSAQAVSFNHHANVEEEAREARYQAFSSMLDTSDALLLAHHQDDQAETLLLQLMRGAGVDGLAGMSLISAFGKNTIVRPLLTHSRKQLEEYAKEHALSWIIDESNEDVSYSRNYLRHNIFPLLQKKWPKAVENCARTAMHCGQAQSNLEALAESDLRLHEASKPILSLKPFQELPYSRAVNCLRFWFKKNQVRPPSTKILETIFKEVLFAKSDACPLVQWGGVSLRRYQDNIYILKAHDEALPLTTQWQDFPTPFVLEGFGEIRLTEIESKLVVPKGSLVEVRFRQGSEVFYWHNQHKDLKKLFQQWHIPPWLRNRIPLLYVNNQLAAVLGYALSDAFKSTPP
jgi:tRNA(Ile)-lysidine synthase